MRFVGQICSIKGVPYCFSRSSIKWQGHMWQRKCLRGSLQSMNVQTLYPHMYFNSLAPGRSEFDSKNVIFNLVLLIGTFRSYHDNALRCMPQDITDDKSKLVQVLAWYRQATSHYLSQLWLSSLLPYGVVRPQWVKDTSYKLGNFNP